MKFKPGDVIKYNSVILVIARVTPESYYFENKDIWYYFSVDTVDSLFTKISSKKTRDIE